MKRGKSITHEELPSPLFATIPFQTMIASNKETTLRIKKQSPIMKRALIHLHPDFQTPLEELLEQWNTVQDSILL